jgi:tetratricopeptide (TPR) repeat protein
MKRHILLLAFLSVVTGSLFAQSSWVATDYEIAAAEKGLDQRDPLEVMAAHLNLAELRRSRNEIATAAAHETRAIEIATEQRAIFWSRGDLRDYATATAWLAFAHALSGDAGRAWLLYEEALRFSADSPRLWNLYASGLGRSGRHASAIAAARTAVAISEDGAARDPRPRTLLDVGIYRHALAAALLRRNGGSAAEAEALLGSVIELLEAPTFEEIRARAARTEHFEVISSVRSDVAAWVSLDIRSRLRLGLLLETAGRADEAREVFRTVLRRRSGEPVALEALLRLTQNRTERAQLFEEAFEANPFSFELLQAFERHLRREPAGREPEGVSPGTMVRRTVVLLHLDRRGEAEALARQLLGRYPGNDALRWLLLRSIAESRPEEARSLAAEIREPTIRRSAQSITASGEARRHEGRQVLAQLGAEPRRIGSSDLAAVAALLREGGLAPGELETLDRAVVSAHATFDRPILDDETTILAAGMIGETAFRFPQPVRFLGRFTGTEFVLMFRILGITDDGTALLLEPLGVEPQ